MGQVTRWPASFEGCVVTTYGVADPRVPLICRLCRHRRLPRGPGGLLALVEQKRAAYMCSEGLWWRCHRRIISDYLAIRGWNVEHIMPDGQLKPHVLAPFARVVEGRIVYDGAS